MTEISIESFPKSEPLTNLTTESLQIFEKTRPKISIETLMLLLTIFGFIFLLKGFWNIEVVLWNRIVYSTGSQWINASPIYKSTPLVELQQILQSDLILFIIGGIFLAIVLSIIVYRYLFIHFWNDNAKIVLIFASLSMCIGSILGFWLYNSLWVLAKIPPKEPGQTLNDWINVDLVNLSPIMKITGLIFAIGFFIGFCIAVILIISHRPKKERKKFVLSEFLLSLLKNSPFYLILIIYLIFTLLPVYLTLKVSLTTYNQTVLGMGLQTPIEALILNYSSVLFAVSVDEPAFNTAFLNSLIIGIGTGVLGLLMSVTAAYALARFKFLGNKLLTFLILTTQMFPGLILLIPQYVIWTNLGLLERNIVIFGVLLATASGATAYCTWMMKGYFETIPLDIEEAALIDGAGKVGTFAKIAFPLAKSGMVAVLIFTFLSSWQEFVMARTFIGETDPRATLPLLFYNYQNMAAADNPIFFELLAPYAVIIALPVVIFFMLLQKQLAAGAVAGAVK